MGIIRDGVMGLHGFACGERGGVVEGVEGVEGERVMMDGWMED